MIGNDQALDVYAGQKIVAGLKLNDDQLYLHYSDEWQKSGFPMSPHLPLKGETPVINLQRFLRNQLPEGEGLDTLLSILHVTRSNTFGLIRALGMDGPGVFRFLPAGQDIPTTSILIPLNADELEKRLDQRTVFSLIMWNGKPRLSVAGVQDKINVVVDSEGKMGFGEGALSSTHILKFEKQKYSHLVINEYLTMQLARQCGIQVADVNILRLGNHPALLIRRFDRRLSLENVMERRHIIDGCQALNLPPDYKYERNFGSGRDVAHIREGASLPKLFNFADECSNPADTRNKLVDWVIFNLLVYNYDAHGKNVSFFGGLNGWSLAPFYDLVNIKLYPEFDHEMAMALGDEFDGETITPYQLADFAESCQLTRPYLIMKLKRMVTKLKLALDNMSDEIAINAEERQYLQQYQSMVLERCNDIFMRADEVLDIHL
jgi:serine/threonine-protein kinase HipA